MATTKFNELHLRLSLACRDEVGAETTDGKDLTAGDRSALLNEAFFKYVTMMYRQYRDDPFALRQAFQSMFKFTSAVNAVSGLISTTLPTDYGFFIALSYGTIPYRRATPEEWNAILTSVNSWLTASTNSRFCYPENTQISIMPASSITGMSLSYIIKPFTVVVVTGAGGTDIPLDERHFNTIVGFAASKYYANKQEFEISAMLNKDAIAQAPFKLLDEK